MFSFEQKSEFDQEQGFGFNQSEHDHKYALCVDLLSVAEQLGVTTGYESLLYPEMALEQLQTIELAIAAAIEAESERLKDELRKLKRCPQGYQWDQEGTGWRCQGGSHYCSAEEIKRYME